MATNVITATTVLRVLNGNVGITSDDGKKQFDQTTAGGFGPGLVTITSAAEVEVDCSVVGTPGYVRLVNYDQTNFVKWGFATGAYGGKIRPGGSALIELLAPQTSIFMRADTADCRCAINATPA